MRVVIAGVPLYPGSVRFIHTVSSVLSFQITLLPTVYANTLAVSVNAVDPHTNFCIKVGVGV